MRQGCKNKCFMFLSIVIPCFNASKTISNTVHSLLNQIDGYEDIELILVDDGSNDSTLKVLQSLKDANRQIKIFAEDNKGVSETRNFGQKQASGKYIWFFDADDLVFENALNKLLEVLHDFKPDILQFSYAILDIKNKNKIDDLNNSTSFKIKFNGEYYKFLEDNFFQPMSWLHIVRKDLLTQNNIAFCSELCVCEDSNWNFQISSECPHAHFIDLDLRVVKYMINPHSTMNTNNPKRNLALFKSLLLDVEKIQNINKKLKPWLSKSQEHYLSLRPRIIITRFLSCNLNKEETTKQVKQIDYVLEQDIPGKNDITISFYRKISNSYILIKTSQFLYRNIFLTIFKRFVPRKI